VVPTTFITVPMVRMADEGLDMYTLLRSW